MKKIFCIVFSLIIFLFCLVGCNSSTNISEENIGKIFLSTLEAECYSYGSAFYDVEKDADNNPIEYRDIDAEKTVYYKAGKLSKDTLIEKLETYITMTAEQKNQIENLTVEKDGDLYINVLSSYGGYEAIFDINSITLSKAENGKYYVSVDEYAYPDTAGNEEYIDYNSDNPIYVSTIVYCTKLENGVLKTESSESTKSLPKNEIEKCKFIGSFDKFWGDLSIRRN